MEALSEHKEKIEEIFGGKLHWYKMGETTIWRIQKGFGSGYRNKEDWEKVQNNLIENMIKLEKATRGFIEGLKD